MKLKRDYVNELNGHYFSWHMMQKKGDVNKKKTLQKLRAAVSSRPISQVRVILKMI